MDGEHCYYMEKNSNSCPLTTYFLVVFLNYSKYFFGLFTELFQGGEFCRGLLILLNSMIIFNQYLMKNRGIEMVKYMYNDVIKIKYLNINIIL